MQNLTVLNDWHIGAVRSGGTTPATAYQLRQDLLQQLKETLLGGRDNPVSIEPIKTHLLFNGDLFDGPAIPYGDLYRTFELLSAWLDATEDLDLKVYLSNGNHDLSKNSTTLSSFQLLAKLLISVYGERVTHIETGTDIGDGRYVIPHMANQDLFDLELAKVPECDYLFVHCNYDNEFAVESDHSLNLSKAWAEKLPVKCIVFGHEHQGALELGGKVVIVGNQVPSSVSDCLGNDTKDMLVIGADGCYALWPTWSAAGDFSEQDWRDLKDEGRFIRVVGAATAAEAATVAQNIARFRQQAKALVITNAVKIDGTDDAEVLALSHEEVTAFNVEAALMELLTEEEGAKVQALLHPPQKEQDA